MRMNKAELITSLRLAAKYLPATTATLLNEAATRLDVTSAALSESLEQCSALAAENAGLKEIIEQHAGCVAVCPNCSHEEPSETDDIVALYRSMETPATDAYQEGWVNGDKSVEDAPE